MTKWIQESSIRIDTVRFEQGFDDLRPLTAVVGDARIVGLGEPTHGSREVAQLKHRLLEYLVSELGFSVFAIEANMPEAEIVNRYVRGELGDEIDAAEALRGLHFWTFSTEAFRDLVEWMRDWNADPQSGPEVRFYGIDMQFPFPPARAITEYIREVHPEELEAAQELLEPFLSKAGQDVTHMDYDPPSAKEALRRIASKLETNRPRYEKAVSPRRWLLARHWVDILEQNVTFHEHAPDDVRNRIASRDRSMAANVQWIADVAEPGERIVVWGHNGHIAKTESWVPWMGVHLERVFGDDYLPVGFLFHHGSFQAIDGRMESPRLAEITVGAPPADSYEAAFEGAGFAISAVDLRGLPTEGPVAAWFRQEHPLRMADAYYRSEDAMTSRVRLSEMFEAVIFVESTTRARPLPER